jgi:hydrogenase maturation factor
MNKKYQNKKITMAHGSGGKASSDLIKDIFVGFSYVSKKTISLVWYNGHSIR